jgi:4'-phosphopantetheinyl transferase
LLILLHKKLRSLLRGLIQTYNLLSDSVQCTVVEIRQENPPQIFRFPPVLKEDSIHIWSARYDALARSPGVVSGGVSREEQKTASAFRNSADAEKYLLRHTLLRSILGQYINCNPEMTPLKTGKNGKPELDLRSGCADISFNLSHTSEMLLIGVTKKRRIGVDIVNLQDSYRFHDNAEYILTQGEKIFLKRTEPALMYQVFFRMWAMKEAILKVTGSTLNLMAETDLSEIIEEIVCSPEYSMHYLDSQPPFFLAQFMCGSEHLGAIAVDACRTP